MALYTGMSASNCVVNQAATFVCAAEPVIVHTGPTAYRTESGAIGYAAEHVKQWRGKCSLVASYSYVGLTKDAALSAAAALREAYTQDVARYAIGEEINLETMKRYYKYVVVGSAPACGASVTPVHEDGPIWRVDVQVAVEAEGYWDAGGLDSPPPSQSDMEALVAGFLTADTNGVELAAAESDDSPAEGGTD